MTGPFVQRERPTQCQPSSFHGKPCYSHAVFTHQVNPLTSLCPTLSAYIEPHVTSQSSIIITHGTQSQPVFICIIVTSLWVKVYNPHMHVEVASITFNAIHWVLLNMLCTYIICLNSIRPIKHGLPHLQSGPSGYKFGIKYAISKHFLYFHTFLLNIRHSL